MKIQKILSTVKSVYFFKIACCGQKAAAHPFCLSYECMICISGKLISYEIDV